MATPIKGTPVVRMPQSYDFEKALITISVPRLDQNGETIDVDSEELYANDSRLTGTQKQRAAEVAARVFRIANKID